MTSFDNTIAELIRQLSLRAPDGQKMRIIITINPDGGYAISVKPTPTRTPRNPSPQRRIDPNTRRIIREPGDPAWGPINQPNFKGRRVGDPPPARSDWLSAPDDPPTRDPGGTP